MACCSIFPLMLLFLCLKSVGATPLDDYVATVDPHYKYSVIGSQKGDMYTVYYINMTSQKWQSEDWVSRAVWWHTLTVVVPDRLKYDNVSYVYINGGSNEKSFPKLHDQYYTNIYVAVAAGIISCHVGMIPNQPIIFADDPKQAERVEDAILSYTFMKYINTNGTDPNVIALLPMTKAVVRTLDTVADFVKKTYRYNIDHFLISGGSKRGWATWLTAAVDPRVIGIAPVVFDMLNFIPIFKHWYRAMGGWSFSLLDYVTSKFTLSLDNAYTSELFRIIDPMAYNDRFNAIPKLISRMTGDEIMHLDDTYYFFHELKGPKYISTQDNTGHDGDGRDFDIMQNILSFFLAVLHKTTIPNITWMTSVHDGGSIVLTVDREPSLVTACYAYTLNHKRRDFRINSYNATSYVPIMPQPVIWKSKIIQSKGRRYAVKFDNPEYGWLAFYIKASFQDVNLSVLELTTETLIIPDSLPFPDCKGATCSGPIL